MDCRPLFFFSFRFWPGFQKLWLKGDFHSLLISLLFGWILAIAWTSTFIWPEWLGAFLGPLWFVKLAIGGLWLGLVVSAVVSAIQSSTNVIQAGGSGRAERLKNLELAQEFYLQANYFEAEQLAKMNLSDGQEDIESALLCIAILRRTRRIPQALEMISNIDRLDAAIPWMSELRAEKEQCLRIKVQTPPAHN